MMAPYLDDHPPASPQFSARNIALSGGVIVHTSEGPTGPGAAEALAAYISRRTDPGSYHVAVDGTGTVQIIDDWWQSYSVAANGYNAPCWNICICGRSSDLHPADPATFALLDQTAQQIIAFWQRNNITANPEWIGEDVKIRTGIAGHGDVQPWDRSDPWTTSPDGTQLWDLLFHLIRTHLNGDTQMRDALIHGSDGAVYRITQPGNVAVWLSPPAYEDAMKAVASGLIVDLGLVPDATLGNFGLIPSIITARGL